MQLRLIRNATLRLSYAGRELLIDPYFAPKHSLPSFAGRSPNPLTDLPCPVEEILEGVELALVSHLHTDHFDGEAQRRLPSDLPIICQPGDEAVIAGHGFQHVTPLADTLEWHGISITRAPGAHGSGEVLGLMGQVMGLVLRAPGEPTIYWAGDTIWYSEVAQAIAAAQPDLIITHACGALWAGTLIVMDAAQTVAVCRAAPTSTVVAVHMEALDHATVTRADLRAYAQEAGVDEHQLRIPLDGARLDF